MPPARTAFHSQLKELTRDYGGALQRYEQAMRVGDQKRADDALSCMQEIESSVTLIRRPVRT